MKTYSERQWKVALFAVLGLVGCGRASIDPEQNANDDSSSADDAVVFRTIVNFDEIGNPSSTTQAITRKQQQEEIAARKLSEGSGKTGVAKRAVVYQDSGCAGSALWLFDGPQLTGNEICVNTSRLGGWVYLRDYCRVSTWPLPFCDSTWDQSVRSYYPGQDYGVFYVYGSYYPMDSCDSFSAWDYPSFNAICPQANVLSLVYILP